MPKHQKTKHNSRKRTLPLILAVFAIIGLLGFTLYRVLPRATPVNINEVTTAGTITLAFTSPAETLKKNVAIDIPITINTGISKVTAVAVQITYDSSKLTIISVTPDNFLPISLADANIETNKVTFTYAAPPASGGKTGSGTIATLKIKPIDDGTTAQLIFATPTQAAAIDSTTNMLKTANPITLSIPTPIVQNPADISDSLNQADDIVNGGDYNKLVANWGRKAGDANWDPSADIVVARLDGQTSLPATIDGADYNKLVAEWAK